MGLSYETAFIPVSVFFAPMTMKIVPAADDLCKRRNGKGRAPDVGGTACLVLQ
jgi:hypothetical protein